MGPIQACLTENLSFVVDSLGRKTAMTAEKNTEYSGFQWNRPKQIFSREVKVLFDAVSVKKCNFFHVNLSKLRSIHT